MTQTAADEDRLFEEAVDLLIRLHGDPRNPVAQEVARSWLARSPAHRRVWEEAAEIHGMAGVVLRPPPKPGASRRSLVALGGLGLGGALAAGTLGPGLVRRAQADVVTSTGEVRTLTLPDGSRATLGPETALAIDMGPGRRGLELLQGMVLLDIAQAGPQPLQASCSGLVATSRYATLEISLEAGRIRVAAASGLVEVTPPGGRPPLSLAERQWMAFLLDSGAVVTGRDLPGAPAAWRQGQMVVEQEPLAAVLGRIARWHAGRWVITSEAFGALPVSGVFDLGRPELALEAVVHPLGGRIRRWTPYLTLISPP
ncbi:FecR family protein [Roseomonas sp. USHLN139]|uniref:FecR family protein n=1 Tax=Roseomonas sp. USHLN139 TaxID=3081298 RepID=UPI003B01BDCB